MKLLWEPVVIRLKIISAVKHKFVNAWTLTP